MTQVASGYNRNHRINSEGGSIPDEWIVEYVADRVETLGTTFLGLTMNCECHDHKYDAVSQKRLLFPVCLFQRNRRSGSWPQQREQPAFRFPFPRAGLISSPGRTSSWCLKMKIKVVQTAVPRPQPGGANTVMVMHELPKPRPTYPLERGQYERPDKSQPLRPAVPEIIGGWKKQWPKNRIGLANWLTDPEHPLTAGLPSTGFGKDCSAWAWSRRRENFGIQGEHRAIPNYSIGWPKNSSEEGGISR